MEWLVVATILNSAAIIFLAIELKKEAKHRRRTQEGDFNFAMGGIDSVRREIEELRKDAGLEKR